MCLLLNSSPSVFFFLASALYVYCLRLLSIRWLFWMSLAPPFLVSFLLVASPLIVFLTSRRPHCSKVCNAAQCEREMTLSLCLWVLLYVPPFLPNLSTLITSKYVISDPFMLQPLPPPPFVSDPVASLACPIPVASDLVAGSRLCARHPGTPYLRRSVCMAVERCQ